MKKIILGVMVIVLALGLVGGGAFAYLNDTETSSGNIFQAGTLNLLIRDQDESWQDGGGVSGTWTIDSDMKPGDSWDFLVEFVRLDAEGSIPGSYLEITCDYQVIEEIPQNEADTDPNTDLDPDSMAKVMEITRFEYRDGSWSIDCLTDADPDRRIEDQDGDGRITFFDLKNDPLTQLPAPDGATTENNFGVKFHELAGNDFQGDTFNLTMTYILHQ